MKIKLILAHLGEIFGTLRFNEKSSLNTLLCLTQYLLKSTNAIHADNPGVYTCEEFVKLSIIDKSHLKSDIIDGLIVDGFRELVFYSFVLDKTPACKVFCQP